AAHQVAAGGNAEYVLKVLNGIQERPEFRRCGIVDHGRFLPCLLMIRASMSFLLTLPFASCSRTFRSRRIRASVSRFTMSGASGAGFGGGASIPLWLTPGPCAFRCGFALSAVLTSSAVEHHTVGSVYLPMPV